MKICCHRFNIYLLALLLGLLTGCQSNPDKKTSSKKKDKEATTVRLHIEVNSDGTERNGPITLFRESPVSLNVNLLPFLTEGDVEKAEVMDVMGVPAIRLHFNWPKGVRLLEMYTSQYKGQHIAVYSQFGDARWLAAPQITQQISDGIFVFTPDATMEESERIVRGLNNIAKEIKKKS